MDYTRRSYRQGLCPPGMKAFTVTVKETDLWLAVDSSAMSPDLPEKVEQFVWRKRRLLERYISEDPAFLQALEPYVRPDTLSSDMVPPAIWPGWAHGCRIGFSHYVGEWLLINHIIVENPVIFSCAVTVP